MTGCQCLYTWQCLVARTHIVGLIWNVRYPYVTLNQPLSQTFNTVDLFSLFPPWNKSLRQHRDSVSPYYVVRQTYFSNCKKKKERRNLFLILHELKKIMYLERIYNILPHHFKHKRKRVFVIYVARTCVYKYINRPYKGWFATHWAHMVRF